MSSNIGANEPNGFKLPDSWFRKVNSDQRVYMPKHLFRQQLEIKPILALCNYHFYSESRLAK